MNELTIEQLTERMLSGKPVTKEQLEELYDTYSFDSEVEEVGSHGDVYYREILRIPIEDGFRFFECRLVRNDMWGHLFESSEYEEVFEQNVVRVEYMTELQRNSYNYDIPAQVWIVYGRKFTDTSYKDTMEFVAPTSFLAEHYAKVKHLRDKYDEIVYESASLMI